VETVGGAATRGSSAAASGMVGVEQPQRHARRSMDGGLRAVDAKLVGVMATVEMLMAPVAGGQLNQSDNMTNYSAFSLQCVLVIRDS